jgi:hypothetical protein
LNCGPETDFSDFMPINLITFIKEIMKILSLLMAVAAVLVFGCILTASDWPAQGIFQGYYTHGFEVSQFTPQGTNEKWWLEGSIEDIIRQLVAPKDETPKLKSPIYIVVEGKLSKPGKYGHLGGYVRRLSVEKVVQVKQNE